MALTPEQIAKLDVLKDKLLKESQKIADTSNFIDHCSRIMNVIRTEQPSDIVTGRNYTDAQIITSITNLETDINQRFPDDE